MKDSKQAYREYMDEIKPSADFLAKLKDPKTYPAENGAFQEQHTSPLSFDRRRDPTARQPARNRRDKVKAFPVWGRVVAACLVVAVGVFAWTLIRDLSVEKNDEAVPNSYDDTVNRAMPPQTDEERVKEQCVSPDAAIPADGCEEHDENSPDDLDDHLTVGYSREDEEKIRADARQLIEQVIARTEDDIAWSEITEITVKGDVIDPATADLLAGEIEAFLGERRDGPETEAEHAETSAILILYEKEPDSGLPSDSVELADVPVSVEIDVAGQTVIVP